MAILEQIFGVISPCFKLILCVKLKKIPAFCPIVPETAPSSYFGTERLISGYSPTQTVRSPTFMTTLVTNFTTVAVGINPHQTALKFYGIYVKQN
jgi:hypothetical protein